MGIGDDVRGAVINVEKLGKDRRQVDSIIPSSIVYVKRGGKFKVNWKSHHFVHKSNHQA